jgi:hypothetical protein
VGLRACGHAFLDCVVLHRPRCKQSGRNRGQIYMISLKRKIDYTIKKHGLQDFVVSIARHVYVCMHAFDTNDFDILGRLLLQADKCTKDLTSPLYGDACIDTGISMSVCCFVHRQITGSIPGRNPF